MRSGLRFNFFGVRIAGPAFHDGLRLGVFGLYDSTETTESDREVRVDSVGQAETLGTSNRLGSDTSTREFALVGELADVLLLDREVCVTGQLFRALLRVIGAILGLLSG